MKFSKTGKPKDIKMKLESVRIVLPTLNETYSFIRTVDIVLEMNDSKDLKKFIAVVCERTTSKSMEAIEQIKGIVEAALTDFTFGVHLFPKVSYQSIDWQKTRHPFFLEEILRPLRLGIQVYETPAWFCARTKGTPVNPFWANLKYLGSAIQMLLDEAGKCVEGQVWIMQNLKNSLRSNFDHKSAEGVLFMLISAASLCLGQLIWKLMPGFNWMYIIAGFAVYGLGAMAMIWAYRYGELSTLQPMNSLSYVFALVIDAVVLKESVTLLKVGGIACILCGILFIIGNSKK